MNVKSELLHKEQCPRCREAGKDTKGNNLGVYEDGSCYCFSCKYYHRSYLKHLTLSNTLESNYSHRLTFSTLPEEETLSNTIGSMTQQYISWRGVTADTMRFYGAIADVNDEGRPVKLHFPYSDKGGKVRHIGQKDFYAEGEFKDAPSLFGMGKFNAGQSRSVILTEGELDAMSAFQMLGRRVPAVSVRSGPSARKDCERARDWLNSFDHIYLCFDNDQVGKEAARDVAKLFDINKVKHVELTQFKDANEYLQADKSFEFDQVFKNAKSFKPKGIVSDYSAIADILSKESAKAAATYPFPTLQEMTYGIRHGELVLFTAQEKIGKTEVMRAIEYHLLKTTDDAIGVIHLEEGEKRATQGLVGYELGVPVHLPDAGVSVEDQVAAYKQLTKRDGRLHFYAHFGSDDPNTILDIIRYLVTVCHCKYIFLDHITMLVTGFEDEDERKKLDYISTRLAMMTRELDFTLFLVSHVNDDGKTRGSRNISKVADLIINLDRNIEGATLDERNTTVVTVRGNRFASRSGPAGYLWFDPKTHTISELTVETAAEWDTKGF
jgi:twinkle protein